MSDTNRDSNRFIIRMPEGMRDRIAAAAKASGRSMNAEIVAALEEKFPRPANEEDFEQIPLAVWARRVEYFTIKMGDIEQAASHRETVNRALKENPDMKAAEFLDRLDEFRPPNDAANWPKPKAVARARTRRLISASSRRLDASGSEDDTSPATPEVKFGDTPSRSSRPAKKG